MSDSNFINNYVNIAIETIHSYVNDSLQLKTQLKILNDLVSQKDQAIQDLTSQKDQAIQDLTSQKDQAIQDLNARIESLNTENEGRRSTEGDLQSEMQKLRDNAASWESQYNNIVNKVSHMDTLTNQYNDLKRQYIEKESEINRINEELSLHKTQLQSKQEECERLKNELGKSLTELDTTKSKLDKLTKKEEKKSVTPVNNMSSKKVINKESNANTVPLVETFSQEIDDF